jgi:hypothetical protein
VVKGDKIMSFPDWIFFGQIQFDTHHPHSDFGGIGNKVFAVEIGK